MSMPHLRTRSGPGEGRGGTPRGRGRFLRAWPIVLVEVCLAVSVVVVVVSGMPAGGVLLGCTLLLGGVLRMVLTDRVAGLLVVRSRIFDVLLMFTLGSAIILLAVLVTH